MDVSEKNGQPSMEEILASIRRIIAEEPYGDLGGSSPIALPIDAGPGRGDSALEDASDFDLPAIFRAGNTPQAEKPAPLLGRLTDAIRNAATGDARTLRGAEVSQAEFVDHGTLAVEMGGDSEPDRSLSSLRAARERMPEVVAAIDPAASHGPVIEAQSETPSRAGPDPAQIAAASGNSDVQRVMAPFKDTRFSKMSGPNEPAAVAAPTPVTIPHAAPAAQPSPAQSHAETENVGPLRGGKVDFGSIVPARLAWPEPSRAAADQVPPPVAAETARPQAPAAPSVEFAAPGLTFTPISAVPVEPAPPRPAAPAARPPASDGGIEDATADLLRPMLRQWLAENMPRMVEKALHIEVAESLKSMKKPGS